MIDEDSLTIALVALAVVIGSVGAFGGVGAAQEVPPASVTVEGPTTNASTGVPTRFDVTLSVGDIDNVSATGNVTVRLAVEGETVATRTVRLSDDQTRTVTLRHTFAENGTYNVSAEGSLTTLGVTLTRSDETTVTVEEGPGRPTLPGAANPATDLDGDGLLEDVNGDGDANIVDVSTFLRGLDSPAVQDNVDSFDFSGDGSISIVDVSNLLNRLT